MVIPLPFGNLEKTTYGNQVLVAGPSSEPVEIKPLGT